jgi:hypothetical protein
MVHCLTGNKMGANEAKALIASDPICRQITRTAEHVFPTQLSLARPSPRVLVLNNIIC